MPAAPPATTCPVSRRTFLVASSVGMAGWTFGRPQSAQPLLAQQPGATTQAADVAPRSSTSPAAGAARAGRARSTILFFLSGGASHLDMWDLKPRAPLEYRGPFQSISTSAVGVRLSEHLPLLAKQAHHLAVVNSVGSSVNTNDHHAGYYYNLTGHVPDPTFLTLGNNRTPYADDWPFMGTVVASKRAQHPYLPNAITLPHKEGAPAYTRPGQFAARLGVEYDPLYVMGTHETPLQFHAPALTLAGGMTNDRLLQKRALLRQLDDARREFDQVGASRLWQRQQQRAMSLLLSSRTTDAFDLTTEPAAVRERYGPTVNGTSLLLARRLVEAEVPFITVFWKGNEKQAEARKCASGGGWDTHGNNFECLKQDLMPEFDRGFSALIEDLAQRGLLDSTLVLVTSEMGRKPKIGDPRSGGPSGAGRDHWTHCLTDLLAGGGIRGGQTYGASDRYGEYPADKPVTPADITKTVYRAMGIENLEVFDAQNRPYNLLAEGHSIAELLS